MSFKSYVQHIAQKYRLAVAISVLKEKPQNISIEKYIEDLRNKIIEDQKQDDGTVCSDDFDMDNNTDNFNNTNNKNDDFNIDNETQDSVTILKGFHFELTRPIENEISDVVMDNQVVTKQNTTSHTHSETPQPTNEIPNLQVNIYNDLTQDISDDINATYCPSQFLNDAQDMDKILDKQFRDKHTKTSNNKSSNINIEVNPNTYDSQATILYTLHGFTENYTHVSQSQYDNITIPENLIRNKNLTTINAEEKSTNTVNNFEMCDVNNEQNFTRLETVNENIHNNVNINEEIFKTSYETKNINEPKETQNEISQINESRNINITELNTAQLFSENINKHMYNAVFNENINKDTNNVVFNENINKHTNNAVFNENINKHTNNAVFNKNINKHTNNAVFNENINKHSNNAVFNENINKHTNNAVFNENMTKHTDNAGYIENINEDPNNTLATQNYDVTNNELASPSQELIPFKVIEELSKVKSYLSKKERRMSNDGSIDSGYRSDSQTKSSVRSSLQLSVNWLNQSAHSLFSYILQCPVVATTQHITNEISQVLGQLIDRLHDEEKYPSFLDELLENVEILLQDVFGGDNSNENVLLKKDEAIQRIFLINTSTHIQKYTIEKITNILEIIQSKLNNPDMYEITNIDEVENMTYIFHILEIILKRYMKSKTLPTENISNSQNEFPKKSSITNIWRKKWNPKFKEDETLEITQKKCVLIHCNKVLNNFVVSCMEGYSLVAFAALQCFNILQS